MYCRCSDEQIARSLKPVALVQRFVGSSRQYPSKMNFVAVLVDELHLLFCEVDLEQSKVDNTIHSHALLLKSLVLLFTTIWSFILSLALDDRGDGKVRFEGGLSQGLALHSLPTCSFLQTLLDCMSSHGLAIHSSAYFPQTLLYCTCLLEV